MILKLHQLILVELRYREIVPGQIVAITNIYDVGSYIIVIKIVRIKTRWLLEPATRRNLLRILHALLDTILYSDLVERYLSMRVLLSFVHQGLDIGHLHHIIAVGKMRVRKKALGEVLISISVASVNRRL